jgi:CheY-like chemotaxis protein
MKHVYIIEDNMYILEGLSFLLNKIYKVTSITDGRIALAKLTTERPDLILLDYLMPDLSGAAFIKTVYKLKLNIPILVMSAYPDMETQLKHPLVIGHIKKPFQIDELIKTIEQALV